MLLSEWVEGIATFFIGMCSLAAGIDELPALVTQVFTPPDVHLVGIGVFNAGFIFPVAPSASSERLCNACFN